MAQYNCCFQAGLKHWTWKIESWGVNMWYMVPLYTFKDLSNSQCVLLTNLYVILSSHSIFNNLKKIKKTLLNVLYLWLVLIVGFKPQYPYKILNESIYVYVYWRFMEVCHKKPAETLIYQMKNRSQKRSNFIKGLNLWCLFLCEWNKKQ